MMVVAEHTEAASLMRNALMVDVEDYFHVAAFARQIDSVTWGRFPLRVEPNMHRLLALFAKQRPSPKQYKN